MLNQAQGAFVQDKGGGCEMWGIDGFVFVIQGDGIQIGREIIVVSLFCVMIGFSGYSCGAGVALPFGHTGVGLLAGYD